MAPPHAPRPPSPYTEKELAERAEKRRIQRKQQRKQWLLDQYGQIDKQQVRALSIKGMHTWLLQGPQLVKNNVLVADPFFKISAYWLKLDIHQTRDLYLAVHHKFFKDEMDSINKHATGVFRFFTNKKKIEAKQREVNSKYERRKIS